MEDVWDNSTRFASIHLALSCLPHDQTAIGLGFKLQHNPASCIRCKANIAVLEIDAILRLLEGKEESPKLEGSVNGDT